MSLNTAPCRQCQGEMKLLALGPIDGEDHGVRMRLEGLPTMQCGQGHKRLATPGFAMEMMDKLLAVRALVPLDGALHKGFLRKRYGCPACGGPLAPAPSGRVEASHRLDVAGLQPFGVQLGMATYRCRACGRESVEPSTRMVDALRKASVHAFRSANLTAA